jgi:hypothetical protein
MADTAHGGRLRIAIAQTHVGFDPRVNAAEIRMQMRRAAEAGARLIQFTEGAISGYPSEEGKQVLAGWNVDWSVLRNELRANQNADHFVVVHLYHYEMARFKLPLFASQTMVVACQRYGRKLELRRLKNRDNLYRLPPLPRHPIQNWWMDQVKGWYSVLIANGR